MQSFRFFTSPNAGELNNKTPVILQYHTKRTSTVEQIRRTVYNTGESKPFHSN